MKNGVMRILGAVTVAVSIFMAFVWRFFEMMVRCKKKKDGNKKKWFQLSHTKINHPRDKFEKEHEEGRQWCRE